MAMKKNLLIAFYCVSFILPIVCQAGTFYVTTNGKSSNDGRSEQTAWSLGHAIGAAKAGDVVYIKAGNYGDFRWVQSAKGRSGSPIRFIGYRNSPGDVSASNGPTMAFDDQPDAALMPLLKGGENRGTAIKINEVSGYVEFHNIQISGYQWGVNNFASNITVSNLVLKQVGPKVKVPGSYDGRAMTFRGTHNRIENSLVVDAGVEGITLRNCDNCRVTGSEVASINANNGTDYYILLIEGTQNATVDRCTVRRKAGVEHPGHGLVGKNGASNNVISNSTVINTGIEMSYSNVHDNLIKNCTVQGSYNQNRETGSNVKVANGAHHNTFENISIDNTYGGLAFTDWNESHPYDTKNAGNNNSYINVRVTNSHVGINFGEFSKTEAAATNNTFTDCTFKDLDALIRVNRPNSGTKLINGTVENVANFWETSKGYDYKLNSNTVFQNMKWLNVGFTPPNNDVSDVDDSPNCSVTPEYNLNGSWQSGENNLSVAEGTSVQLSMLPNGVGLTIKLPNGQTVGDNYRLGQVTASDSGAYVLTSENGCQSTLNLTVGNSTNTDTDNNTIVNNDCVGTIIPEYRLNGSWASGQNNLNVAEGTDVQLSMLPNGVGLTIKLPNGQTVGDNYRLGKVTASDSGVYVLTSEDGCQSTLNLTVGNTSNNCPSGSIIPEYNIGGVWSSGQNSISVAEGKAVTLSMLPNGVGLTIRLPNGTVVGDNHKLGKVTAEDSGVYVLTSEEGCQTSLNLTVNPQGSSFKARIGGIVSENTMNSTSYLETAQISVYPNPVQRTMNVFLPDDSNYVGYVLYTLSGVMVQQGEISEGQNTITIDVTGAPKGLLIFNLQDNGGQYEFLKILKE